MLFILFVECLVWGVGPSESDISGSFQPFAGVAGLLKDHSGVDDGDRIREKE